MGEKRVTQLPRERGTHAPGGHTVKPRVGEEAEGRGEMGTRAFTVVSTNRKRCASGETEAGEAGLGLASVEWPLEVAPGHEGCPLLSGAWPCDQSR